ncbi:MAG: hypothetical protein COV34_03540 [Candidatus Zambryskibacteria bacterium CG10_big_fil_rev_8_21_14_0_10_42_12]|uniref:Uncharacterized protein n=1 Tax=Candidatus Zambryskibacteria bacterium CG10_big_fil_rev_8_21_14_0_10_42_12 TaxID=1975115 RepID=A0A2H0QSH6_9BACT|nr:MAG: hypothetical protein COV34_03540 [Candidatus Zambryskibacteria bacterium CG10_big_fil_rev_8_21_14_0_10_42_12]
MKKTLKFILILALIGGFALFIFWLINPGRTPIQNGFISKVRDFNPFGGDSTDSFEDTNTEGSFFEGGNEVTEDSDRVLPAIEMIYSSPVGGYTLLGDGSSTTVRVVDRATGHIIDINTITKEQKRISNTTLPGIIEATWFNEGKGVVMRYLKESSDVIETLIISNLSTTGEDTAGTYLEENIASIKPISNTEIAYIIPSDSGSGIKIYNTSANTTETLLTSTIREWKILGGNKNGIYVQTKASYSAPGYVYRLTRPRGELLNVLQGRSGLNAILSNDQSTLFATTAGNDPINYIFDQNFDESSIVDMQTIADKCVFTSNEELYCGVPIRFPTHMPDVWYMGTATLADQIWKTDTDGTTTFITGLQNIDIIKPQLSENEEQFFFTNKSNGSVWIVRLNLL